MARQDPPAEYQDSPVPGPCDVRFSYAAETWTLLSCDEKTLEAFHMNLKCQRQILHIHWSQHVTNAEVSTCTDLPPVMDFIRRRRLAVFGDIARLTQGTPAHNALHCQVGLASGLSLGGDWRRRPGRSRARWTDQLRNDTGSVPVNLWRQTGHSTGPWRSNVTARAGYAMTTTTTILLSFNVDCCTRFFTDFL